MAAPYPPKSATQLAADIDRDTLLRAQQDMTLSQALQARDRLREQFPALAEVSAMIGKPEAAPAPAPQQLDAVLAERGSRYGSFAANSYYADKLIEVLRDAEQDRANNGQQPLTPYQRNALVMIFQKTSRILSGDASYADNWVDIAGFASLGNNPR
jgi:hypothetical protein